MANRTRNLREGTRKPATRNRSPKPTAKPLAHRYAAISAIDGAILRSRSPHAVYQGICDAAVATGQFLMAAVMLEGVDASGLRVAAIAGTGTATLQEARIPVDASHTQGPSVVATAFREGAARVVNDDPGDSPAPPWDVPALAANVAASAALPLFQDGETIGVWLLCAGERNVFDEELIALLTRNTENVAFALRSLEGEAERQRVEQALRASEERYRSFLDSTNEGYYEADLSGTYTFVNDAYCRMRGFGPGELLGVNFRRLVDSQTADTVSSAFNRMYLTGGPVDALEYAFTRRDGSLGVFQTSVQLRRDVEGKSIGFRGVSRDVTRQVRAEEALRNAREKYRIILESMVDAYYEVDLTGTFSYFNAAAARLHGYSPDQLIGMNYRQFQTPEVAASIYELFNGVYRTGTPSQGEWEVIRPDGSRVQIEGTVELVKNDEGTPTGFRGMLRNITERKRAEERIQYLATHDGLTGLPNRVMFSRLLGVAIQMARRYERTFAVLFVDLDRFKVINDTLGHDAGDTLLQEITARFTHTLRASDVVGRLGGDEFVVLVQETDRSHAAIVAHKLLLAAMKPLVLKGHECRVTASIGIAMYPDGGEDEQALMKSADIAMYLAKEEGKNNFQFYSADIKSQAPGRLALETKLRRALENDELVLHYQAKVDLESGAITGVEALLRWQNPELGLVAPSQFISLAEETGLIVPIGRWVLRTACEQNVAWQREGLPAVCMAVNLSGRQFHDENLLNDITAALQDSGLAPALLELEITEGMVVQNPERATRLLVAIKSMGVRLAIDDFGTGYSSLGQLKSFPIDTLKIDRSFIREIPAAADDRAITQAIIAMGKTLNLIVVAEGVETEAQAQFLREHACDEMQGFYFSRPVPPEQFAELLRQGAAR